jgi:protein TonB
MFKELELSGTVVVVLLLLMVVFVIGLIFYMRYHFSKMAASNLTEKYRGHKFDSPVDARTKYPEVDAFAFSYPFGKLGLIIAMATILFAFSWTRKEVGFVLPDWALDIEDIVEVEPPRTAEPPPPPPPPPPPVFEEVPEDEVVEEMPELSTEVDITDYTPPPPKKEAPPPPPPPPPPPKEEEIFKIVEQMPRFPGCEDIQGTQKEKEDCAKKKMLEFIYKNLKYPPIARENGVEGTAVIQFTVDKDGSITNIEIARDPGAGTGEAAKAAVEAMNNMPQKWTPGKQRGVPVKVLYTMPVRFKLEG